MTLGNRIQEIRIQAGLSQEAFGEKIGVTRQTVSKWELDQVYPEIEKIVLISKIFKVTTDSLLIDGIDTFDVKYDSFVCGVYKSKNAEIVVTNKYTLYFYVTSQHVFGVKLYQGFETNKSLIAIVERDVDLEITKYAYKHADNIYCNDEDIKDYIGEKYEPTITKRMNRIEKFDTTSRKVENPKVSDVGIKKALIIWRLRSVLEVDATKLIFYITTPKKDYAFTIQRENDNIYCFAAFNEPFDLGMRGGFQNFRIRNYNGNIENKESWCKSGYDFITNYENKEKEYTIEWLVKNYTDDEIILYGCSGDEYKYTRNSNYDEKIIECE